VLFFLWFLIDSIAAKINLSLIDVV
jgi:hypothetical protein